MTRITPASLGLPADYRSWDGDAFEDHIGPFFFRMDGRTACTAFRVQEHNCNGHHIVHGGSLMTFADYTLCIAAIEGGTESVVTVTCNNEFVGPAYAGDIVTGRGEVTRVGGSLIFARAVLEANGQVILTSSGVLKRLRT